MSEDQKKRRFITGKISRCNLATGNKWGKFGVHIDGYFEDDGSPVERYISSKYKVKLYEGQEESDIDPTEADGLVFNGRVMVNEAEYDGQPIYYLQAVCIDERLGKDEYTPFDDSNPFLNNPLTAR